MTRRRRPSKLTTKQRLFLAVYFKTSNPVLAADKAGYAEPKVDGPKLLAQNFIKTSLHKLQAEYIDTTISDNKVLEILSDIANFNFADVIELEDGQPELDFSKFTRKHWGAVKKLRTIKTVSPEGDVTRAVEIDTYDKLAALKILSEVHGEGQQFGTPSKDSPIIDLEPNALHPGSNVIFEINVIPSGQFLLPSDKDASNEPVK